MHWFRNFFSGFADRVAERERIERLESQLRDCQTQLTGLREELFDVPALPPLRFLPQPLEGRLTTAREEMRDFLADDAEELSDAEQRYLLMQMFFRGPMRQVNEELHAILDSIQVEDEIRALPVWDIGCGRGELLHLLNAGGFHGVGVDTSALLVKRLSESNLEAHHGDAIETLEQVADNSLCGVTAFHVIEHLESNYVSRFLEVIYRKLAPGGFVLLETPNPFCFESLSFFYTDDTHVRPIQPFQLAFMVESAGFVETRSHFAAPVPATRKQAIDNWMRHYQNHGLVSSKPRKQHVENRAA